MARRVLSRLRVGGVRGSGSLTVFNHAGRAAMLGIMAFSAAHFIPGSVPFFFNA